MKKWVEEQKRRSEILRVYKKDLEEKRKMKFFDENGNEMPNPWKKGRTTSWWKPVGGKTTYPGYTSRS